MCRGYRSVDQRLGGARKPVVAPDQYRVELPFLGRRHHPSILGSFIAGTRGLVYVFFDHGEAPPLDVFAQRPQLRSRVLAFVEGGDAGVEGYALGLVSQVNGYTESIKKEILFDRLGIPAGLLGITLFTGVLKLSFMIRGC